MNYVMLADTKAFQFVFRRAGGKHHVAPKHRHAICGNMVTWHNDVVWLSNHSLREDTVCKTCVALGRKRGIIEEGAAK